jgi:hypothetical protein
MAASQMETQATPTRRSAREAAHEVSTRWRLLPRMFAYARERGGQVDEIIERLALPTNIETMEEAVVPLAKTRTAGETGQS